MLEALRCEHLPVPELAVETFERRGKSSVRLLITPRRRGHRRYQPRDPLWSSASWPLRLHTSPRKERPVRLAMRVREVESRRRHYDRER